MKNIFMETIALLHLIWVWL